MPKPLSIWATCIWAVFAFGCTFVGAKGVRGGAIFYYVRQHLGDLEFRFLLVAVYKFVGAMCTRVNCVHVVALAGFISFFACVGRYMYHEMTVVGVVYQV